MWSESPRHGDERSPGVAETLAQSMAVSPNHGGPAGAGSYNDHIDDMETSYAPTEPCVVAADDSLPGAEDRAWDRLLFSAFQRVDWPCFVSAPQQDATRTGNAGLPRRVPGAHESTLLLLGHMHGFQVVRLDRPAEPEQLACCWGPPTKLLHVLASPAPPRPAPEPTSPRPPRIFPLDRHRPLMAVAVAAPAPDFALHSVRLYSLRSHRFVHSLRFRREIYDIASSQRVLCVATRRRVYAFHARSMENAFSVPIAPTRPGCRVLALGPRWMAVPAPRAPQAGFTGALHPALPASA
eukprot:CAMPEP_0196793098 /NCGR_PEP_ID=MMETSP1104-20130614/32433_1 /TAXON_ID=33652 /ORGANISM="Cafeteria sp., Strain Caron Lab Isolate" /LENGTH=294 /DNA_ID=CAMNT_0042163467 /DNA_START=38 /DNA_END=918 /DNA_ORIENTATION=-